MDIFVTGTDTGVGKTIVTAGLAAVMQGFGYKMGVYKPVQSGIPMDTEFVESIDSNIQTKVTYALKTPAAPCLAADIDNVTISKSLIKNDFKAFKETCDIVITEGAGGLLVPITEDLTMRGLIKLLNLPVLIVARPHLGTINHTLLTIEAAQNVGLDILGVIISDYPVKTSNLAIKTAPRIISEHSGIPILGILPSIKELSYNSSTIPEALIDMVINNVDIQQIFRMKIPKLTL